MDDDTKYLTGIVALFAAFMLALASLDPPRPGPVAVPGGAAEFVNADVTQDGHINGDDHDAFSAAFEAGSFGPLPEPDAAGFLPHRWHRASRILFRVRDPGTPCAVYLADPASEAPRYLGHAAIVPGHPTERYLDLDGPELAQAVPVSHRLRVIFTTEQPPQ